MHARQQEMPFDLHFDPRERNNRVADPAMSGVLGDVRGRLNR